MDLLSGVFFWHFPGYCPRAQLSWRNTKRGRRNGPGLGGAVRGREAAALDAAGATLGSIGLAGFALVVWQALPLYIPAFVLGAATLVWLGVSGLGWKIRKVL